MNIWQPYKDFYSLPKSDPAPLVGDIAYRFAVATVGYVLGIILALSIATGAWAADMHGPHAGHPEDLKMHEVFYKTWKMPNIRDNGARTTSCCNDEDCYATPIKARGGHFYALRREDQRWVEIPDNKLEQNYMDTDGRESPDGRSHVCQAKPAWMYDGYGYSAAAPINTEPVDKDAFIIALDGVIYCATLGGAT